MASDIKLYEGNWSNWSNFILNHLDAQGYDVEQLPFTQPGYDVDDYHHKRKIGEAILDTVHPGLVARISRSDRRMPWKLLKTLRTIAHPFRFMDLPPELRRRVHDFIPELTASREASFERMRFPSVTRASTQLRNETLPLYYKNTNFVISGRFLDLKLGRPRMSTMKQRHQLQPWLDTVVGTNVQDLRLFKIIVESRQHGEEPPVVQLRYSGKNGIEIEAVGLENAHHMRDTVSLRKLRNRIEALSGEDCSGKVLVSATLEVVNLLAV